MKYEVRARIDNLNDLIKVSIRLDNKLYQRNIERHKKGGFAVRQTQKESKGDRDIQGITRGNPMQLDTLILQVRDKSKGSNPRECQTYRKTGHIVRNYRSKNKVQRSQLNILQLIFPDALYYNKENEESLKAVQPLGISNNNKSDIESIIKKGKERESPKTIIKDREERAQEENKNLKEENQQLIARLKQLIVRYKELTNQIERPRGIFEALGSISDKARDYPSDPRNFKHNIKEQAIYQNNNCQTHKEEKKYYKEFAILAILICPRAASWYLYDNNRYALYLIDKR